MARGIEKHAAEARNITYSLTNLVHTRVSWLAERIADFMPDSIEIAKCQIAYMAYGTRVTEIGGYSTEFETSEEELDNRWRREETARQALIAQVKVLAGMQHPPRRPPFVRLRQWTRRCWKAVRSHGQKQAPPAVHADQGQER